MKGTKLFLLVLVCAVLRICHSGKVTETKIKTDLGGGECVDDEDCNNNGVCKPSDDDEKGKGKCSCAVNFSGPNCDKESKMKLGPVLAAKEDKTKGPKKGKKRERIHKTAIKEEEASKKTLQYDSKSNVFGITPATLAKAQQPFLFYNPDKKRFLFVSYDRKKFGNYYVEGREDRLGERNQFLLKDVPNEAGKYFIYNIDQKRYLYVSNSRSGVFKYRNNNVLAAEEVGTGDDKIKFVFEFKDEDGDGFYEIVANDLTIYLSSQRLGIPLYPMAKATDQKELKRWDSRYFQLTLLKEAKSVNFKISQQPEIVMQPVTAIDSLQTDKLCHKGKAGDADQESSTTFTDESSETRSYTKTQGFTFKGDLKASFGALSFTYSNTQSTAESETTKKVLTKTLAVKVKVNQCACIYVTFKKMKYKQPFVLEATTYEGKTLVAKGEIEGDRFSQFEAHSDIIENKPDALCPHEVKKTTV